MELPLAALSGFRPKTGTIEQWNAAYVRVEDYLRAHRIHSRLHQSRLIEGILARAARKHEANPALDPTTVAAHEAEEMMQQWFDRVLGAGEGGPERRAAQARLAMLLADVPTRWPYAFLDEGATPDELCSAVRKSSIQAGPDMAVSSMVPREIDLGAIPEVAGDTLEAIERWPIVRLVFIWALFIGALGLLFVLTR